MSRYIFGTFFFPLSLGRLWVTLVWSLALAVGVAGLHWAEGRFDEAAAGRIITLLPRQNPDEAQRCEIQSRLAGEAGISGAQWRSPAELTRQLTRRYPQPEWQGLFPPEEGWLPWVLEVRPSDPLKNMDAIRAFLSRRQQEDAWRLVLWDGEPLQALIRERLALRSVLGFWLALLALAGMAALRRLPWPERGGAALVFWSALLGMAAPAAVWSVGLLADARLDANTLGIAVGAGFFLATLIAPLIRVPARKSLSIELSEDSDERAWKDPGASQ